MSLAIPQPSSSHRSWWLRSKSRDKQDPVGPSVVPLPSKANSKFNPFTSAFAFTSRARSKSTKLDTSPLHLQDAFISEKSSFLPDPSNSSPTKLSSPTSPSRDDLSSDGPITPTSSKATGTYYYSTDRYAYSKTSNLKAPSASIANVNANYNSLVEMTYTRPRASSDLNLNSSKSWSTNPIFVANLAPFPSEERTQLQPLMYSPQSQQAMDPELSYIMPRSSIPGPDSSALPRRTSRSTRDRLPLPKAPPEHRLPPTPVSSNHNHHSPQALITSSLPPPRNNNSASQTERSRPTIISLKSSSALLPDHSLEHTVSGQPGRPPSHSTESVRTDFIAREQNSHKTFETEVDREVESQLASWQVLRDERSMKAPGSPYLPAMHLRNRVTSDASSKSVISQEDIKEPKRQRSFHQLKPPVSFLPSLRHASSLTPPALPNDIQESSVIPESRPQRPVSQQEISTQVSTRRRRLFSDNKNHASLSKDKASAEIQSRKDNDEASVFSLPTDLYGGFTQNVSQNWPPGSPTTDTAFESDWHILPPDEVMRLMDTPIEHSPSRPQANERDVQLFGNGSKNASSTLYNHKPTSLRARGAAAITYRTSRSSTSYTSEVQSSQALRPPPRKTMTGSKQRHRARGDSSSALSQPPVSSSIRTVLNDSTSPQVSLRNSDFRRAPNLRRTASFLTLDDEHNTEPGAGINSSVIPAAGWESDTTDEKESFLEFDRGMTSIDSSDGVYY